MQQKYIAQKFEVGLGGNDGSGGNSKPRDCRPHSCHMKDILHNYLLKWCRTAAWVYKPPTQRWGTHYDSFHDNLNSAGTTNTV